MSCTDAGEDDTEYTFVYRIIENGSSNTVKMTATYRQMFDFMWSWCKYKLNSSRAIEYDSSYEIACDCWNNNKIYKIYHKDGYYSIEAWRLD